MINSLGLDENTIKSLLTYTHGSITTKDVKEWTRKFESKLLARDVGAEKRNSTTTTTTRTSTAAHYQLDEDNETLPPGQDEEELHLVEAALEDLQGPGADTKGLEDEEGEELALEEYETAEILNTMLSQRKKTFTQSARLKKAKELARGYSEWRGKGSSAGGSNKGRGKGGVSVDELKAITRCAKCKKVGHWHRECPERGKGKEIHFLEKSGDDFEEASFCGLLEYTEKIEEEKNDVELNGTHDYIEMTEKGTIEEKDDGKLDYEMTFVHAAETDHAENSRDGGPGIMEEKTKTSNFEPPTEPKDQSQENPGDGNFPDVNPTGILPDFCSYKDRCDSSRHENRTKTPEHEILWAGVNLSRSGAERREDHQPRTWRDPQPDIDERCCATLDTGCQRMAVGRDTLNALTQAMPQDITIGTLPQEHRFRSVHGRSSTSRVASIPTSLGHKGSVLRPAIFEDLGSRGAPFLISLPFMMFCRSVLHLDPEDGLRIYFRKFKFSVRCHLGPTGALRVPLNHSTPEQLQEAQRTFQEANHEFEIYRVSEERREPSESKRAAQELHLDHGANGPHGDCQQEGTTGGIEEHVDAEGMGKNGQTTTLRGAVCHTVGVGHPRDQDEQDHPGRGVKRGVDKPTSEGAIQRVRSQSSSSRYLGGGGGIRRELGDDGFIGDPRDLQPFQDELQPELLSGQDGRHPRGAPRQGVEGQGGATTDVRTRRTVRVDEGEDDRRIGRETLLEMRTGARTEVQGLRMVQASTLVESQGDRRRLPFEDTDKYGKDTDGDTGNANGVLHLLGGKSMRTQEDDDTRLEQLHLSREVQGLREVGEGREATLGRSGERIPQGAGEATTEAEADTQQSGGRVRGLQAMAGESEHSRGVVFIDEEESEVNTEIGKKTIRQAQAAISEAEQVVKETMSLLKEQDPEKTGWSQFKRAVFDGTPLSKRKLKSFSRIIGLTPRNLLTVAELYNPERFAQPAKKLGFLPGEAYDLQLGDDLLETGTREAAREYFRTVRPGLVVISPPCTLFSRLQQLSRWKTQDAESMERYLRRLRQAKVLLHFGLEIAQEVKSCRGIFVFEHPLTSEAWSLPKMQQFIKDDDNHLARGDQCMYGLVDYNGEKLQKPTGWITNSTAIAQRLSKTCNREHRHAHILGNDAGGSRSAQAQHYPKELVMAILQGYRDHLQQPAQEVHWTRGQRLQDHERGYHQFYLNVMMTEELDVEKPEDQGHSEDKEQEFEDSVDIDEEVRALPRERPFSVEQLVRKAHEGMGHPGNDRLVSILKAAKASPEAIKIARELHCSVCHQHQHTRTPRPAAPPKELKLNSVVGIDTLYLPTWEGKHRAALNIVDWASRFQMIVPLQGQNPAAARQAYLRWIRFFGPPAVLKVDLGREFIGAFELGAELDATVIEPSSLEMPTQRSITERAGRSFKEVFSRALMHHAVQSEQEWLDLSRYHFDDDQPA